jgi:hypothetical protein
MRIYIPTMGRVAQQDTWNALPAKVRIKYKATLVCPPSEVKQHRAQGRDAVACGAKGISATRQWIIEHSDDPWVLMLDDDLGSWAVRRETGSYTQATDAELVVHFGNFVRLLKSYGHGSIGHRLFANAKDPIHYNSRMLRALAYHVPTLKRRGVEFRMKVMEDFDVTLQLLKAGVPAMIYSYMVQDQRATNAAGGCSTYRTLAVQTAAAHELAKRHPDCVQVVEKSVKEGSGAWKGIGTTRIDVRVAWAKAAKIGGL